MISDFTILAFRNIKNRKLRTFLTLIGIVIAIATIFTLISVSIGLNQAVQSTFEELGTDKFFVQSATSFSQIGSEAVKLTTEDAKVISRVSGVKQVSSAIIATAKIEFNNEFRFVSAIGIDEVGVDLYFESGGYKILLGKNLQKGDSNAVVLGSQYYLNSLLKRPITPGDTVLINDNKFKVKGILDTTGSPPDDKQIYMTEETFREFFNVTDRVDSIVVQVDNKDEVKAVANRVEKKLFYSRNVDEKTKDFSVLTPEDLLKTVGSILNIITAFLLGVAAISMLVGGIGIANTMFTSVLERTKEIGVMKAIGAQNKDILLIFLIEAGILGILGGTIGVAFGAVVVKVIEIIAVSSLGTNLLQAAYPWYLILGCLAFAFVVGAISGLYPAYHATKIRPVEALRYE